MFDVLVGWIIESPEMQQALEEMEARNIVIAKKILTKGSPVSDVAYITDLDEAVVENLKLELANG